MAQLKETDICGDLSVNGAAKVNGNLNVNGELTVTSINLIA